MADLGMEFDHTQVESNDDFAPIPNGIYNAQIIESVAKENKAKTGWYLQLTWEVADGEFEKRRIWQTINYKHTNSTAQKIGQGDLKSICEACGVPPGLTNSEVLHGIVCRIKVGLSKPQEGYEQRNEVKRVYPYEDAPPVAGPTGGGEEKTEAPKTAARPAAPTTGRPWGQKQAA